MPTTVDVVVPVYRGIPETRRCLESVLKTRRLNRHYGRLIIVDDDCPEPALRAYLADVGARDGVLLLTNPANVGYVASINRGIATAEDRDVILLNSDTEVSGDWVDRLARQAHADPAIGTVTPFSNNGTICSYPDVPGRPTVSLEFSLEEIDRACADANAGRAVDLPTGVGFCMLVKRVCLAEVGSFDEATFGAGYGEEVDFCQRALQTGWRHILAGDVFVFHIGGVSFAESSAEKMAAAEMKIRRLHPTYHAQVARWLESDAARPLRLAFTAALAERGHRVAFQ